jgi:hypothetical protein
MISFAMSFDLMEKSAQVPIILTHKITTSPLTAVSNIYNMVILTAHGFSSVWEMAQEISKGLKPPPKERQAPDPSVALSHQPSSLGLTRNLDDLTTYASIASIFPPFSNHTHTTRTP